MSYEVRNRTFIEVVDTTTGKVVASIGTLPDDPAQVITGATGAKHEQAHSVAAAGTQELFNVSGDLADFDFASVLSTQNGELQLVVDDNGTNGEAYFIIPIFANHVWTLHADDSRASDGSVDSFNGTADVIERLLFKNTSGATAVVKILAVT